jgi:glucose-6-phosphate isomerase
VEAGPLPPTDVERTAGLLNLLVRSTYHHYAFAATTEPTEAIADHVRAFCLVGIGGSATGTATAEGISPARV